MGVISLPNSTAFKEKFVTELAGRTQSELKQALREVCKYYLIERRVEFQDAMGSLSVMIEHRLGGYYVITTMDAYRSPKEAGVYAMTGLKEDHSMVKEIQALLQDYGRIADRLFALEFSFYVGARK